MGERHLAVAAPNAIAAEAGGRVGSQGGNAVDAAIAAIVAAACTEPGVCSPLAGAFVTVWAPGQEPRVVDGNTEMPGRGRERGRFGVGVWLIHMAYGGGTTLFGGPGSAGTAGMFAALGEASMRWGVAPWRELLAPTVEVLRAGFPLGAASAYYLQYAGRDLFAQDPETVAFLHQHGGLPTAGALMRHPDLAASMERLGEAGAADLYVGDLARAIATDMDRRGGLVSAQDLASYEVVVRPALRSRLGEWELGTNAPPSIGGPTLTAMLRLLQQRRLESGRVDARDVAEIQRLVLSYRRRHIDPADDLEQAVGELVRALEEFGADGLASAPTSPETIHVSAVDSDGLACAITASAGYGSGVTVPGTGLMHNNALGELELNRRGLHKLAPGTRLASNMAPSVGRRDDGTVLAIGSPGADRITTALFQVLDAVCVDGLDLREAIERPRLHVTFDLEGEPVVEHEGSAELARAVAATGMAAHAHEGLHMYFGGVGAALCRADGGLTAAADPRRSAATTVT